MRSTPEHRNAYEKRVAEEESKIIAALEALVHHPANGRKIRSRLVILQNVLAELTGIQTTPKPRDKTLKKTHVQKAKENRRAIKGVIQQLRDYIVFNRICGKDDNLHCRRKVLEIVYEKLSGTPWRVNASSTPSDTKVVEGVSQHLETLQPASPLPTVSPPSSSSSGSTPVSLMPSLPTLPMLSPMPSITAPLVFTPLHAASPAIALEASTHLVSALFSSVPDGAVPMLPAQCFTIEQHVILQGVLPMESYKKLFFSIPNSSPIQ